MIKIKGLGSKWRHGVDLLQVVVAVMLVQALHRDKGGYGSAGN